MSQLIAPLILALILILFLYSRKRKQKGDALLLVGASDAGKTTILSRLLYNQTVATHSSLQVNSALVPLPEGRQLRVIDVPGHPRLREQFKEYLKDAKVVAFIVDSSTISRNGAAVAEHLHAVLQQLSEAHSLVIVAHKADLLKSGGAVSRVKSVLERELEKRRQSVSVDDEAVGLESEGGVFRFGDEIEFVDTTLDALDPLLSVTLQ